MHEKISLANEKISLSNEIKVPNQILAGKIFRNSPNVIQLIPPILTRRESS